LVGLNIEEWLDSEGLLDAGDFEGPPTDECEGDEAIIGDENWNLEVGVIGIEPGIN